jgi:membrane protein implicated in regulation of membrane protease activity
MLEGLDPGWLWMIGGVLLLIMELIAPGFFLVFIGAAALATGFFAVMLGLGLVPQLALFALYSIIAVMVGRRFYNVRGIESSDPHLNDRAARMVGRSVIVVTAVDEHSGRVRVGDSEWSARGGPAEPGERVRITGVEGNCLIVEPDGRLSAS